MWIPQRAILAVFVLPIPWSWGHVPHGNSFLQGFFNAEVFQFHFPWIVFLKSRIFSFEKKAPGTSPNVFVPSISKLFSKKHRDLWERPISRFDGKKKRYEKSPQGIAKQNGAPEPLKISCDLTCLGGKTEGGRDVEMTFRLFRPLFGWLGLVMGLKEKNRPWNPWNERQYREKYLKMVHERNEWIKRLNVKGHELWDNIKHPTAQREWKKTRATLVLLLMEEILQWLIR